MHKGLQYDSVASAQVEWVGQPIGLIVAESRALADRAASLVKVGLHPTPWHCRVPVVPALGAFILLGECGALQPRACLRAL